METEETRNEAPEHAEQQQERVEAANQEQAQEDSAATESAHDPTETGPIALPEDAQVSPTDAGQARAGEEADDEEGEGVQLAGTASEQAPGVGGTGDHPAPAAVIRPEDGQLHVAGEPPAGTVAGTAVPAGDAPDLQAGEVTDPEARERLNATKEPEQIETERPDLGTE
jgi:hypothetical protein